MYATPSNKLSWLLPSVYAVYQNKQRSLSKSTACIYLQADWICDLLISENMDDNKASINLQAGLHSFELTSTGVKFNQGFFEKRSEVEDQFNRFIIIPINEAIGLHNWGIHFFSYSFDKTTFIVDIYCDSPEAFSKIMAIVTETFPDITIRAFNNNGDMDQFWSTK